MILAMFPGQGSQSAGMATELLAQFPKQEKIFEEASDSIGINMRSLCTAGSSDDLALTANTQPTILTVSIAIWRILKDETGLNAGLFAGHSLGEYSALVAADKLDFNRAVSLVRKRGEAMQEAVPKGLGAMAAVINPDVPKLSELCQAQTDAKESVEIVNFNSPQQVVLAGHKTRVDAVCAELEKLGTRFVMLNVSAPFHSRLMRPARERMTPLIEDSEFNDNDTHIIPNLDAKIIRDYQHRYLIEQIDHPVLWTQTMVAAEQEGCTTFIEIGPGKVLAGLAKRCLSKKDAVMINTSDIPAAIKQIQRIGS